MYKTEIYNFSLKRGATFNPSIKVSMNKIPMTDWTNWSFAFNTPKIKPAPQISVAPDGSLAVFMPPEQSAFLRGSSYEYNLQLTDPSGVTGFPIAGHILVSDPNKKSVPLL